MSARSEHAAVERANLPVADLRRDLEQQIAELLSGRATNVSIDTDETAGRIEIAIDVEPSLFDEESDAEAVANAAPTYTQWLRQNSSRELPPERDEAALGATYGEWFEARGGK